MDINRELLDKIAHLARLEVQEKDAEKMMQELTDIITWMDKLNEVDTEGVEPLTTMSHEINAMRDDQVGQQLSVAEALKNAPQKDSDFFHVPKVLE